MLGLAGALAIGVAGCFIVSATLAPFVIVGGFAVLAYNLELFGGRFHTDFWFAAAWGAFPALTGWWSNALAVSSVGDALAAAGVTVGCFGLSVAQRRLSTPVRELRRGDGIGERRAAAGRRRRSRAQCDCACGAARRRPARAFAGRSWRSRSASSRCGSD